MAFREINVDELTMNPFQKIGKEWFLVSAGDEKNFNTMTASWGGVGVMWGKNIVSVYIRPQRYTKQFVDNNELFTIAFFGENYRDALTLCGKVSGRDEDKVKKAGLTPHFTDGTVAFEEADLVLVCKKQYHQPMLPECFDEKENIERWYPQNDYHVMYMAEIVKAYAKEA